MTKNDHISWYLLICALASRSNIVSIVFGVMLLRHLFLMGRNDKAEENTDD